MSKHCEGRVFKSENDTIEPVKFLTSNYGAIYNSPVAAAQRQLVSFTRTENLQAMIGGSFTLAKDCSKRTIAFFKIADLPNMFVFTGYDQEYNG